jgi:general secretion pathway protein G
MKVSLRRRRRRGFTLMELLLVLAILVILGSMVGVSIFQMQKNANIKAARTQIGLLEKAITAYQVDVGSYPPALEGLLAAPGDLKNPTKWAGPYLEKGQLPADPWGNPFAYELQSAEHYRLWSAGPDGQNGTPDDVQNL